MHNQWQTNFIFSGTAAAMMLMVTRKVKLSLNWNG